MRSRVAQAVQDRLGEPHLLAQGSRVRLGGALVANDDDLARAVADRRKEQIDADRGDVEHFEWNRTRGQTLAAAHGVPSAVFSRAQYEDRNARDQAMADWLRERGVRLVVLAGYMELLGEVFLGRFPGATINVHPSLLPAFPGLRAIEQALAYGVKVFGVTVHFVDEGVDSGPVILQRAIELPRAHDPEAVREALRPLEHELLAEAVRLFACGAVNPDPANPRRTIVDRPAVKAGDG